MMDITVAYDGSKYGQWALEWAGRLPLAAAPRLKVVLKSRINAKDPIEVSIVYAMPFEHDRMKCAEPDLNKDAQQLRKAGFRVSEIIEPGEAAPTILKLAAKQKPDLIVMGAQGLGAVARFFLGSVSYQVLQHAASSVLIIK